jgi:hypothetical protein
MTVLFSQFQRRTYMTTHLIRNLPAYGVLSVEIHLYFDKQDFWCSCVNFLLILSRNCPSNDSIMRPVWFKTNKLRFKLWTQRPFTNYDLSYKTLSKKVAKKIEIAAISEETRIGSCVFKIKEQMNLTQQTWL